MRKIKRTNIYKKIIFALAIYGSLNLFYFFYKDILLRNTRIFKSCPYGAINVNIEKNSSTEELLNNNESQIISWMGSRKILIKNPKTNRCELLKNYIKKGKLSPSLYKQISESNIKNLSTNKFVVFNIRFKEYEKVKCPNSSFKIAYFGQSNSANSVNEISRLNIPKNLYQYNWKDNNCYRYKEPLLGSGGNNGNTITPSRFH